MSRTRRLSPNGGEPPVPCPSIGGVRPNRHGNANENEKSQADDHPPISPHRWGANTQGLPQALQQFHPALHQREKSVCDPEQTEDAENPKKVSQVTLAATPDTIDRGVNLARNVVVHLTPILL